MPVCYFESMRYPVPALPNQKFNRFTYLEDAPRTGERMGKFICDCGTIKEIPFGPVFHGRIKSCGCLRREKSSVAGKRKTHGLSRTPTYKSWIKMKERCLNEKHVHYGSYGAIGIGIYERWATSFEAFFADLGERPSKKHSLDRINNNLGYQPGNCKWSTKREQSNNRKNSVYIEFSGVRKPISEWARDLGVPHHRIHNRIKYGWPLEVVLSVNQIPPGGSYK